MATVTTPAMGGSVIGQYYVECGAARETHPEAGAARNAEFLAAKERAQHALAALGLPWLTGLPYGRAAAIESATEAFAAWIATAAGKAAVKAARAASEAQPQEANAA